MVGQSCPVPSSWFRTLIIISSIRLSLISRSQKSFSSEVQFLSPARRFETANTTGPTEDIDQGRRKRVTFRIGDSENPNVSLGGKKNSMELQDGGGGGGGGGDQEAAGARSEARFEIVVGSHQFTVYGYSLAKGIGAGKYIASDSFTVAGHEWAIYFYPDGKNREDETQYVSVFIARLSEGADVRALFELTLLDQTEKKKHKVHSHFERKLEHGPYNLKYRGSMWGYHHFYRRASLEKSDYLSDDKLSFTCKVGVVVSSSPIGPKFSSTSQEQEPITPRHHKRRSSGGSTDGSSESSGIDNLPIQDLRIQEKQSGPAANTEMES